MIFVEKDAHAGGEAMARTVRVVASFFGLLLASPVSSGQAEDLVRVGLAVPNNAIYAPFYAAETLSLFRQAGLKVELTVYRGGAASQEALSAGAADVITYFGGGAGLAILKGAKEKVVAAIDPSPHGWHLLVAAKSPYNSVNDLAGKKIGITVKGGTSDIFALWAAERAGINIQTIPVGGGGLAPALTSGQVDAIAMFPGTSLQLVATGKARSLLDFGKEMEPTLPDVAVASQEIIDRHPEQLRGLLEAFYTALGRLCTDRAFGLNFLKDFTKESNDQVNTLTYDSVLCQQSRDGLIKPDWMTRSLGIAGKAWDVEDLRKMRPTDVYTDKFTPVAVN
jgi:NitT/TauT family transport system substrate-binding protein